jgi:hypothetical protein
MSELLLVLLVLDFEGSWGMLLVLMSSLWANMAILSTSIAWTLTVQIF